MPTRDSRVEVYIDQAALFAQPILTKIRELIFKACPDAVETIKWSFPNYEIHGSMLCSMAAFKEHCSFGLWKAALLADAAGILRTGDKIAMGHLDKLKSVKDLPADKILIAYLREAELLNKNNIKLARTKTTDKKELPVPKALKDALHKNKKALTGFNSFSPSQRKEYIEWVHEAKTEATIQKRVETAVAWSAEGKTRNWKYKK